MQQNLEALSHENMLIALLVMLVIAWAASLIMDFVIKLRTLRKPQEKHASDLSDHQKECSKRFDADQNRLDDLERRMDSVEEGQRVLCKGMYVVIEHMLHNGNEDDMKRASASIFDFLNS